MSKTFEILILGSSSATPTKNRHPTAQYIRIGNKGVLLDCGEGTQMQMLSYGVRHSRIDYIVISHMHGDHYFGLPGLIGTMNLGGRLEKLVIAGPKGLKEFIELTYRLGDAYPNFEIEFLLTDDSQRNLVIDEELFTIETFPLNHRIPTTGFLFQEKKSLPALNIEACEMLAVPFEKYKGIKEGKDYIAENGTIIPNHQLVLPPTHKTRNYAYCSDTLFDIKLSQYFSGFDLLYHEATFTEEKLERAYETYHSTAIQAAKTAKEANASRLLLGHFSARYKSLDNHLEEARSIFGETYLAEEGKVFELQQKEAISTAL